MLENHLNTIEKVLHEQGRISSIAGHPDLIGSSREWFVKNFLIDHLPDTIGVGQGEIINSRSQSASRRNQTDIVLYHRNFPKIVYSQNNTAFFRESVVATIEVKSTVNMGEFRKSCKASAGYKDRRYFQEVNPKRPAGPVGAIEDLTQSPIASYVVSYYGSSSFSTVANWLPKVNRELKTTPDQIIDMVIVLGKGTAWRIDSFIPLGRQLKAKYPEGTWAFLEQENKNLLLLFLHMLSQISPIGNAVLEYAKNVPFSNIKILE